MATLIKFRAEVAQVMRYAADVATYEFRCLDRRPRYKPGQFLHLALDSYEPSGHWPESRVFTIANGSTDRDKIRLTIAAKGRFTQRILEELQPGRQVWMKAPYGDFIVAASPERETVLVAGGTGVTPFAAFLEDALVTGLAGQVWLHYGARRADLLVFKHLADACTARFPSFNVQFYAESGAGDGIVPGRIDLERVATLLPNPLQATFYLCGPPAMIEAIQTKLVRDHAISAENIRKDAWT